MKYKLLIGRFSPFHDGHKFIIDTFINSGQPICIAVRESAEVYRLWQRLVMIYKVYKEEIRDGLVKVITIPDIDQVIVGRKVGYVIVEVPLNIRVISGKEIRDSIDSHEPDKWEFWSNKVPPEVKKLIEEWENDKCVLCGQFRKEDCGSSDEDEQELQDSK